MQKKLNRNLTLKDLAQNKSKIKLQEGNLRPPQSPLSIINFSGEESAKASVGANILGEKRLTKRPASSIERLSGSAKKAKGAKSRNNNPEQISSTTAISTQNSQQSHFISESTVTQSPRVFRQLLASTVQSVAASSSNPASAQIKKKSKLTSSKCSRKASPTKQRQTTAKMMQQMHMTRTTQNFTSIQSVKPDYLSINNRPQSSLTGLAASTTHKKPNASSKQPRKTPVSSSTAQAFYTH